MKNLQKHDLQVLMIGSTGSTGTCTGESACHRRWVRGVEDAIGGIGGLIQLKWTPPSFYPYRLFDMNVTLKLLAQ